MVLVKFEGNAIERAIKLDVFDPSSGMKWHKQSLGEK